MKLQAIVVGSGKEDDPYRVPLPTYVLEHIDYQLGVAVVDVPDDVYGLPPGWGTKRVQLPDGLSVDVAVPTARQLTQMEAMEAERYPDIARARRLKDVIVR